MSIKNRMGGKVAFLLCAIVNLCSGLTFSSNHSRIFQVSPRNFQGASSNPPTPLWVFPNEDIIHHRLGDAEYHAPSEEKQDYFEWELIKKSALQNKGQNMIISPFSAKLLLAILREAARSETRDQLQRVLRGLPSGASGYIWFYEALKSLREKRTEYKFSMGTKFFYDNHLKPTDDFLEICSAVFQTESQEVNFGLATEVVNIINNWSKNVTNGHIEKLVDEDTIIDYVALITNSAHFKGEWHNAFSTQDTRLHKFRKNSKNEVLVPMMFKSDELYFLDTSELNGAKILRMPYKGGKYAMTLLLPHNPNGLDEMLADIKRGQIQKLQKKMERTSVFVALPKFKFETITQYREILEKMNVTRIFSKNAQLPDLGYSISEILQKVAIAVNEGGTEVFATTEVQILMKSTIDAEFKADHPFAFFIEDETTGALLFAGKIIDPIL